jgi:RND superfamily putative drug exporter
MVTGESAGITDWMDNVEAYTPIVFIFVLSLSFVLLALAFRSVVVPATSIVLNLLSVGAAYGLVVLVFQEGIGAEALGFQQVETIEAWLPLFLFSILFGLSMDYHVFLVSRIRERFDQTGDNSEAVAFGLKSTAGLITGAAVIMVAVFGGFALGDMPSMQQMGFGLAIAVFLDATIVRSLLVPSTMKLLGNRNWYLPSWLTWLPDLRVEGAEQPALAYVEMTRNIPVPGEGD